MPLITDVCRTCGQTYGWHMDNQPRHPFIGEDDLGPDGLGPHRDKDKDKAKRSTQVQVRNQPVDLGLRIALIQKGLLTPGELGDADDQLREAIDNGNVLFVGGLDRQQRDAAGSDGDNRSTPPNAPLGPGGGSQRGLRSADWPLDLEGSSGSAEAPEHLGQAEGQLEDRYGLGDAPPVPGYHSGGVLRPGDGVAQSSGRDCGTIEAGPGDDEDRRSLRRRNRAKRRGGEV